MLPTRLAVRSILTASILAMGTGVHAATLNWTGSGTATTPGDGIWDLTAGNLVWTTGTGAGDTAWTAANAAVFGGTNAANVTVGANFSFQRMYFATTGYTLSASAARTISVTDTNGSASPQIRVASGVTATIGANVTITPGVSTGVLLGENGATPGGTIEIYGTVDQTTANTGGIDGFGTVVNIRPGGSYSMNSGGGSSGGIVIGSNTGSDVTVNVEGGTFNHAGSSSAIRLGVGGNGTLNLNSGTMTNTNNATNGLVLGNASGITGTVNLNGGTLNAAAIKRGTGIGIFNFNGGTLKPTVANTTFFTGLTRANVRDGGAVVDTGGFNITVGQALEHSSLAGDSAVDGGLTKKGAGTLTLTASNSFTGLTTVNAGTLLLNNAAANSTTIVGDVVANTSNAAIVQLGANNQIADTSTVTLDSGAKFILGGFSDTIGALRTNSAGTSSLVEAFETGGTAVTGTLTVNQAVNTLFDGIMRNNNSGSGALALVKAGPGTLTLTNTGGTVGYTFTGGATVNAGTLLLSDTGNGKTIGVFNSFLTDNATLGLEVTAASSQTLGKSISGSGGVAVTAANVGTVVLNQFNTYTGDTTVDGGTLQLDGSIAGSTVQVHSGGTLSGIGQTGAVNVAAGGTLAPGDGVGSISTGPLALADGSKFKLEIGSGTWDEAFVNGGVTLDGTINLDIALTAQPTDGTVYTFLSAFAGVSGYGSGARFSYLGNTLDEGEVFTVTGAFTQQFTISYTASGGTEVALTATPEPGSAALLLGGMGLMLGRRSRRRRTIS